MKLTTKGQYAVRALVALAFLSEDKIPVSLEVLSNVEDISRNYLEQLFFKLKKRGIVCGVKGPGGGYILGKSSDKVTVSEIIFTVEDSQVPLKCFEKPVKEDCDRCLTHNVWLKLSEKINEFLSSITLKDIVDESRALLQTRYEEYENNKVKSLS